VQSRDQLPHRAAAWTLSVGDQRGLVALDAAENSN